MHGMHPADVRTARVLELGCGDGANLIPMAYGLPDTTFTGIDLSPCAIARGREAVEALGLKNIELTVTDLMDYRPQGSFDYIIAHGLYSWVPESVRERLLQLCDELLSPHGIAFISYLALPGTRYREPLRELLLERTAHIEEPSTKIAAARDIMRIFCDCPNGIDPYQELMRTIARDFADLSDAAVFHDWLADINAPFSITQFVANARRHNLRFLGEAEYYMMRYEHDPMLGAARDELRALEERDPVLKEQYLDFLRARRFRQTLLCRDSVQLRPPTPSDLFELAFTSRLEPVGNIDVESREIATFRSPVGNTVRVDHPGAKAALLALHEARPAPMPFRSLLPDGTSDADAEAVARLFLVCLGTAYMEPYSIAPPIAVRPGTRPRANAVARYQITRGNIVASLLHANVKIDDPLGTALLQLLDGTRDRSALAEALLVRIQAGELPAPFDLSAEDATATFLAGLDHSLEGLGRSGLLEA
ncbi:methyltransferase regulatory domain-containing protein [Methylocaldum szegediense]|uniref:Methyltransferase domain-containing protein n=1 Tax=Methylocaldum szegediense TaxID=73780 RepID=A0ABM9I2P8_9GAMM|nr:class I SAM-dependent methyltransferase [Methylocaldum szegediense]CAI8850760.1 Methyltransferase domain-containing protein [Methylocaldum szegediense]